MKYYYKLLKEDYNSVYSKTPFHLGLNEDPLPFNDDPKFCGAGGIYFSDRENIMHFLRCDSALLCKIRIPRGEKVVRIESSDVPRWELDRYKAHAIFIEEIHDMRTAEGIDWMKKKRIYINWKGLSKLQLQEDAIRKYSKHLWFTELPCILNYSYDLIHEFSDRIDWKGVSLSRIEPSIEFANEFKDYLKWDLLSVRSIRFSKKFRDTFKDRLKIDYYKLNLNDKTERNA